MKNLDIIKLSARHIPIEKNSLYFSHRIHEAKSFSSADEAIDAIITCMSELNIFPDSMGMSPLRPSVDLIRINIFDEAICAIYYELINQYYKRDIDFILYIVDRLTYLISKIDDYTILNSVEKTSLQNLITYIRDIYSPLQNDSNAEIKEESYTYKLSFLYYSFMHAMYSYFHVQDDYINKMKNVYGELMSKH